MARAGATVALLRTVGALADGPRPTRSTRLRSVALRRIGAHLRLRATLAD